MQVLNCTLTDAHYSRAYLSCYVLQDYKFFCGCERSGRHRARCCNVSAPCAAACNNSAHAVCTAVTRKQCTRGESHHRVDTNACSASHTIGAAVMELALVL
eukprot:1904-Heterococcus_DN1.PRE.4